MMKYDKPIYKVIEETAIVLTKIRKVPFTRKDIINLIKYKYKNVNENTINPMIQGITENLKGGAPGGEGKNILYRIEKGNFILSRNK